MLEISPIPGKAKDYYVVSFMAEQVNKVMIMTTRNEVSSDSEKVTDNLQTGETTPYVVLRDVTMLQ